MSFILNFVVDTLTDLTGYDVSSPEVYWPLIGGVALLVMFCCYCFAPRPSDVCPRTFPKKTMASSSVRIPRGFLKKTNPANPPKLFINEFQAPVRADRLPQDTEGYWEVEYKPYGNPPRPRVNVDMYLNFNAGRVRGVGMERERGICKVEGKYKYNETGKLTVLAMTTKYSNDLDKVIFHGVGVGTAFSGNCYIVEIDRFALSNGVPGVREMFSNRFRGSFRMLLSSTMGEDRVFRKLHSRGVMEYAGNLMPNTRSVETNSSSSTRSSPLFAQLSGHSLGSSTRTRQPRPARRHSEKAKRRGRGSALLPTSESSRSVDRGASRRGGGGLRSWFGRGGGKEPSRRGTLEMSLGRANQTHQSGIESLTYMGLDDV